MKSAGEKWLIFKTQFTELQQLILRIFAFAPQYFTPFQIGKLIRESNHDLSPITDEIKDAIRAMRECAVDVFSFTNNYSSLFQTEVLLELCDDNILESFYQNFIGPHLSSIRQWETADKRLYLRYFYLSNKDPKDLKRNVNFYSKTLIKPQSEGFSYTQKINPQLIECFWFELMNDHFFTGPMSIEYKDEFDLWLKRSKNLSDLNELIVPLVSDDMPRVEYLLSSNQYFIGQELIEGLKAFFRNDYRTASKNLNDLAKKKLDKWSEFPSYLNEIYLRSICLSGTRSDRKIIESMQLNQSKKQALLYLNDFRNSKELPPVREITPRNDEIDFYKALRLLIEKRQLSDNDKELFYLSAKKTSGVIRREWLHLMKKAGMSYSESELAQLDKRHSYFAYASVLEIREPWETGFEYLEKFFSEAEKFRLIWVFTLNEAGWDLRPIEQKLGKSGWTKGKQISCAKLEYKDYLSDLDRQILNFVVYQSGNYIEWSSNAVLEFLARHHAIYDLYDQNCEISIEIDETGICLEESDNYFVLDLPSEYKRQVILKRIAPYQYRYYKFPDFFDELSQKLGEEGLKIPKHENKRLRELLPKISQKVPVMSQWHDKENRGQIIEANTKIRVIAEPLSEHEGISFKFRVPVFDSGSPEFPPGQGLASIWKKGLQCLRDMDKEKHNLEVILSFVPGLPKLDEDAFMELRDQQMALDFLSAIHENEIEIYWPKKTWSVKQTSGRLALRVDGDSNWFNISGEAEFDDQAIQFSDLLQNLSKDGSYLKLSDQRFIKLTRQLKDQISIMRSNLGEYKGSIGFPRLSMGVMAQALANHKNVMLPKSWDADVSKIRKVFKRRFILPRAFKATLRTYQEQGFQWLSRMAEWGAGACLADDMGLGKTVQALAVISARAHLGPTLVVAPTSVCPNWLEEVKRFAPMLNAEIYDSSFQESYIANLDVNDLLICSYAMLQRNSELFYSRMWNGLILDEAQAIKNPQSGRSKAARNLRAQYRIATTGTPVENHPGEIWALFDFLNPGYLGSQRSFGKEINSGGVTHFKEALGERLQRRVQPFILRRLKTEVLKDLPERTEVNLRIPQSDEELGVYNGLRLRATQRIGKAQDPRDKFFILEEITRLRQAACSPALIDKQFSSISSKLKRMVELVNELRESGHRCLIFSQFTSFLDLAQKQLLENEINFVRLDGSTPASKRQELVRKFQQGKKCAFLISLKAGGFGLNLTAANYVIHLDPWWNPAVEDQATDRVHRIGQEKAVTVYRLISQGTIEEKILKLHESKRELADFLLGTQSSASKMSADDLIQLLR